MNTKTYNSSLPLLAAALSDQRGIRVEIGGNNACTDGKTIRLPSLPLDADDNLLGVARGYIDHESAHVLFTDFSASSDNHLSQLEKFFANAIEDVRVEKLMADRFPGCRQNFRQTAKHVFVDRAGGADTNPAFAVPNYVLLRLRRKTCPELAGRAAQAALDVMKYYPDLLPKLLTVIANIDRYCPDTASSIAYGKKLAALLHDYEQQHGSQPDICTRADADGSDNDDDSKQGQPAGYSGVSESDANDDSQGKSSTSPSLESLFADDVADRLPNGMGEALAEELESGRSHDAYDGIVTAIEVPAQFSPMPLTMMDKTVRLQASLRPMLRGVLQADTYEGRIPAMYGTLNPRKLYSVSLGDGYVFTRHVPARLLSTAVHILIDRSGSTTAFVRDIAISAYGVAHAAAGIRGVSVGMSVFPVIHLGENDHPGVSTLIRYDQTVPRYLSFDANGLTPLAEAVWHVLPSLMKRREPRKILLIFTDGQPDSDDKAKAALRDADRLGIELYGVSFRNCSILSLLGSHRSAIIHDIDVLPNALSNMLISALRRAA